MRINIDTQLKIFVTLGVESGSYINNFYISSTVINHVGSKKFVDKSALLLALADLEIENSIWGWGSTNLDATPLSIPETEYVNSVIGVAYVKTLGLISPSSEEGRLFVIKDRLVGVSLLSQQPSFAELVPQLAPILTRLEY